MKRVFYKAIILVVTLCTVLSSVSCNFTSFESEESYINKDSSQTEMAKSLVEVIDNLIIVKVDGDYFSIKKDTCFIDYMQSLKNDGAIDFTIVDGMIKSINGVENLADFTKCWMLYSNDGELSNESWGTVVVKGETYFSAVFGAEALPIKDGKTYVWEYKSF